MRERGFEPLHPKVLDPKSSASASSATLAQQGIFSWFFQTVSRANRGAESLFKIFKVSPNKAFVCEAVIGVVPYNHMVEHLDHQELGRPYQIPGELSIFDGGRGIPGRMIMDKTQGCR